ncbi:phosphatidylethanolamine-binding protein [Echria macrotheca]|uniref:Large ribosomal subunit protein mL38 n=1 Tax=Echria macrotheca TaxID=438768 RepID=A0AAJ0BLX2_9PEZI|nr:phosphatidylethanolamine-binding protein [Echria macrotheca]
MSRPQQAARPIVRSIRHSSCTPATRTRCIAARQFSSTPSRKDESTTTAQPNPPQKLSDTYAGSQWTLDDLQRIASPSQGSLRRRAALATSYNIPFEQMPYQCFQEARKILNEDRQEKIAKIVAETEKIKRLEAADPSTYGWTEAYKNTRLASMRKYVEELKILADINDPLVKRRFEDGMGDMNKPIYRYLANRKWHAMDYKIIVQRINQFHIVPDILPKFDPTMDVRMSFRGQPISPGTTLNSRVTEVAPTLKMQVFDKGERLLSVIVLDADVPSVETDTFTRRCHFLAANIPWDQTKNQLALRKIGSSSSSPSASSEAGGTLAVPWLPPFAQKGTPYHRLAIFVLEQESPLDPATLKQTYQDRENFSLKSFRDKFAAAPVGFTMFRAEWDDNTADVMGRHGIPGADVEFKAEHFKSLKTPRKARGWEAKRQKAKFKSLWKYTKRIA